ncbi:hypothetical protein ACFQ88_13545 [Paenibacillus sp. NPDC056579]|uniref:hypothetical protein n=1 Tax=unclassified Paenibacillus TaxID=185978 RepID=UPI001EF8A34D|nr:hypothetical protein [Paenibacillus sp. H1-7]ULL17457.1 hypothetical protein DVH26_25200 [Paenibacillus sp. H1-7]
MYQNYQQSNFQQYGSGNTMSQYRGLETKYQPIGYVQSQYNQSNNSGMNNQFQSSGFQGAQSYHTSNYRGNQQGHDAYLRSDSSQPAQSQYVSSFSSQAPSFSSINNFSQQSYAQPSAQSFHTANYRGDQQGHDAYLRSDSSQPAQSQFGMGASSFNSFNTGISSQFASSQPYSQFQSQSPQSYHTANYRGNQAGHDAYLRADSTQPSQSSFGAASMNFNRYQY